VRVSALFDTVNGQRRFIQMESIDLSLGPTEAGYKVIVRSEFDCLAFDSPIYEVHWT
jgi:hypothetical protein